MTQLSRASLVALIALAWLAPTAAHASSRVRRGKILAVVGVLAAIHAGSALADSQPAPVPKRDMRPLAASMMPKLFLGKVGPGSVSIEGLLVTPSRDAFRPEEIGGQSAREPSEIGAGVVQLTIPLWTGRR